MQILLCLCIHALIGHMKCGWKSHIEYLFIYHLFSKYLLLVILRCILIWHSHIEYSYRRLIAMSLDMKCSIVQYTLIEYFIIIDIYNINIYIIYIL